MADINHTVGLDITIISRRLRASPGEGPEQTDKLLSRFEYPAIFGESQVLALPSLALFSHLQHR